MSASLVGSEMCIRDRAPAGAGPAWPANSLCSPCARAAPAGAAPLDEEEACLLYTSDAADDM
eukprot:10293812-Alexandrium_andersonii.AAC.1